MDDSISEIMNDASGRFYVERNGLKQQVDVGFPPKELKAACVSIAAMMSRSINVRDPIFEGRLADGSRVTMVFPPVSSDGILLTFASFQGMHSLSKPWWTAI
jgi:pilus assembly protein CpaF